MSNVSNYVKSSASCPNVSIQVSTPGAHTMSVPIAAPTMVLNNGCYPASYYLNTFANPAIMRLNQAALANQMAAMNKINEEAANAQNASAPAGKQGGIFNRTPEPGANRPPVEPNLQGQVPETQAEKAPEQRQVVYFDPATETSTVQEKPASQTVSPQQVQGTYTETSTSGSTAGATQSIQATQTSQTTQASRPAGMVQNKVVNVHSNPIKSEVAIPKELVNAIERIAKNTTKAEKPKMELTDHYVRNLESYLNSQDKKLRIMAGEDVVARLQEDDERKDNPALTALINKMLQDPEIEIRGLSLGSLQANIVTGDDFTNKLLRRIAQVPESPEADVAKKVLLRMPPLQ